MIRILPFHQVLMVPKITHDAPQIHFRRQECLRIIQISRRMNKAPKYMQLRFHTV